jgi:hypothetical protein
MKREDSGSKAIRHMSERTSPRVAAEHSSMHPRFAQEGLKLCLTSDSMRNGKVLIRYHGFRLPLYWAAFNKHCFTVSNVSVETSGNAVFA